MIIDHVGIAIRSLEEGIKHWKEVFGYRTVTEVVTNTRQKVKVIFLDKPGSLTVKLIEPTDETSPIYKFSMQGGGLHHLCFRCKDLSRELARLKSMGLRVLAPPQSGEAFGNEKISFIYAKHGMNIELIDTDFKAKKLDLNGN